MRRSHALALLCALPLASAATGCDLGSQKKIDALEKRVAELERKNEQLERRMAHLGAERAPGAAPGAAPNDPLQAFGKLFGKLAQGNFKLRTQRPPMGPGRATPMDPELQKRIDKLMVDGVEKLSKSEDAKELLKAIFKTMKSDLDRQAGGTK